VDRNWDCCGQAAAGACAQVPRLIAWGLVATQGVGGGRAPARGWSTRSCRPNVEGGGDSEDGEAVVVAL